MPAEFDKDVLNKADALLKRHAARTDAETGAFPVLTDLVDDKGGQDDLARDVFKRVMLQVEGRLSHDLEARLAQHLAPQIHAAVISALGDLRQELSKSISDAISEAIAARNKLK